MTKEERIKNLKELYAHLQTSPAKSARDYRHALREAIEILSQERPKGRWIENRTATYNAYTDDFEEVPHYNCSLCDCPMDWKAPFCPECGHPMKVDGADMRESEQE